MFPFPNVQGGRGAPRGPQAKFSRTDRSLAVTTLSESDRRIDFPASGRAARNNRPSYLSGKFFAEFEFLAGSATAGAGFCQYSFSLSSNPGAAGSVAYRANGAIFANNVAVASAPALAPGDRVGIAVNIMSGRYWISLNNVWLWGNPNTETGGLIIAFSGALQLFAGSGTASSAAFRLNDQSTYPPPTGFEYWPIGNVETTWNASDVYGTVDVSQNDQRVLTNNTAAWSQIGAKGGKSSGKWWYDISFVVSDGNCDLNFGILSGPVSAAELGQTASGVGLRQSNGSLYVQGAFISSYGSYPSNAQAFVVDFDAERFWIYRYASGSWLGVGGNPNAGGAGFAFSKGAGLWRPALSLTSWDGSLYGGFISGNPVGGLSLPVGFNYWNDN